MANTSLLQVRTLAEDKEKASAILEKLGTNLSAVLQLSPIPSWQWIS